MVLLGWSSRNRCRRLWLVRQNNGCVLDMWLFVTARVTCPDIRKCLACTLTHNNTDVCSLASSTQSKRISLRAVTLYSASRSNVQSFVDIARLVVIAASTGPSLRSHTCYSCLGTDCGVTLSWDVTMSGNV